MKLPRIVAQVGVPSSRPTGGGDLRAAGAPAQALAQGGAELGTSVARTADVFAAGERQKQLERENDEALGLYLDATKQYGELDTRLKVGAVDPATGQRTAPAGEATYVSQWEEGSKAIEEGILGRTSNDRVGFAVRRLIKGEQARGILESQSYANKLFKDTKEANLNTFEGEIVNRAAAEPDETRLDFWRGLHGAYLASNANWMPEVERQKRSQGLDEKIGIARANVAIKAGTFDATKTAELVRDPIKLNALIDRDVTYQERRTREAAARDEKQRKEDMTRADIAVSDAVNAGDYHQALAVLDDNKRVFEGPRYEHWLEKIKKGPTAETRPEVRRELLPLIYNVNEDPRRSDALLRARYAAGRVGDDDFKVWGGHLESRLGRVQAKAEGEANRAEQKKDRETQRDEGRLKHEEGEAQQRLRELTRVTGPAATALNPVAQDTLNWGLEDMGRNSPLYGGSERPMAWLERNQAQIMGRIATVGTNRLKAIDDGAAIKDNPAALGSTIQAAEQMRQQLLRRQGDRTLFKDDAAFYDQVRMVDEKVAIIRELERFGRRPAGGAGTPPPARPGGSGEPALQPAGKKGGR